MEGESSTHLGALTTEFTPAPNCATQSVGRNNVLEWGRICTMTSGSQSLEISTSCYPPRYGSFFQSPGLWVLLSWTELSVRTVTDTHPPAQSRDRKAIRHRPLAHRKILYRGIFGAGCQLERRRLAAV
ncbi:hypothetical protein P152DRAFT_456593 [Eremomyces bilateralis CBS 781.70]|uniref:Uncharacterized protein n=1 Tax=Eremomyces bilateralis CBS 781.70 TaxID=1392243 RepID=A0A6G1G914_9PEZI|nr:uncharacterized protein P152DRAFT_456593 [Eremomyces bilateralis CBS 781.70]KAF1814349.1 hypothetical protein P152DRAFT_456593 [Eremomyces bilateralis CBS 781.70]